MLWASGSIDKGELGFDGEGGLTFFKIEGRLSDWIWIGGSLNFGVLIRIWAHGNDNFWETDMGRSSLVEAFAKGKESSSKTTFLDMITFPLGTFVSLWLILYPMKVH